MGSYLHIRFPLVDLEENKNDSEGIFSQAPFIGLIAAVAALIVIVILLAVFILVKTRSRKDDDGDDDDSAADNASRRERQGKRIAPIPLSNNNDDFFNRLDS